MIDQRETFLCNEFKKEEFHQIIQESQKITHLLSSLEEQKRDFYQKIEKYDPKAIYLAHQHLAVIQSNMKEQLCELRTVIRHLEENNIIELEETNSYQKMKEESKHFDRVFKIFLPYILICSIYLKVREREVSKNTSLT